MLELLSGASGIGIEQNDMSHSHNRFWYPPNLLKCIHSIFIDVNENKEQVGRVLLGVAPRVSQDGELIKCIPEKIS